MGPALGRCSVTELPRTAAFLATLRAAHQRHAELPLIEDQFAEMLCPPEYSTLIERLDQPLFEQNGDLFRSRGFLLLRSRIVDDVLVASSDAGFSQYVAHGAGLDATPLRFGGQLPDWHFFETDQAFVLDYKKRRLREFKIRPPSEYDLVPVDGDRSVSELLADCGFDRSQRTLVSCMGVLPYLSRDEAEELLRSTMTRSGVVLLDIHLPTHALPSHLRDYREWTVRFASESGETMTSFYDVHEAQELLSSVGYEDIWIVDLAHYESSLLTDRTDGMTFEIGAKIMIGVVGMNVLDVIPWATMEPIV